MARMPRLYADLVLREAKIATLDTPNRFVGALAARDGRIVAVGADAELDGLIGPDATVVRLGGRTVIPGIVDSHCHADSYAVRQLTWHDLSPSRVLSRESLLASIERVTRESPRNRWFVGYRYDERRSGGYPTLAELDAAGHARPVFLVNRKTGTGRSLDASQAVTVEEVLRAYTVLRAYAGREERVKGRLAPGMLADFVVLDRDLFTIPPDEIRDVCVERTYVSGVERYRAS